MQELVKITESPGGKQVVSARELYDFLGLERSQWARWYRKNIVDNPFSIENTDWRGFDIMSNGNESKDFHITIDFAKRLSMMTRNEKGEEVRRYFIECERKLNLALPDFSNPAEAARAWATQYEEKEKALKEAKLLQEKVAEDAPKVEYFDKLISKDLLTNFRDTAKELGVKQTTFIKFLLDRGYVYRDQKQKLKPHGSHMDLFEIKEFVSDKGFASTQTFINPKGRATFLRLLEVR